MENTNYVGVHVTRDLYTNNVNFISSYLVMEELNESDFITYQRGKRVITTCKSEIRDKALLRYNNAHNCNINPYDFAFMPYDEYSSMLKDFYPLN